METVCGVTEKILSLFKTNLSKYYFKSTRSEEEPRKQKVKNQSEDKMIKDI